MDQKTFEAFLAKVLHNYKSNTIYPFCVIFHPEEMLSLQFAASNWTSMRQKTTFCFIKSTLLTIFYCLIIVYDR